MFWNSLATTSSAVDTALEQPDVSLESILGLEEVLQELRVGNKRLSDFLLRQDNMYSMLDLITTPPNEDLPVAQQYRFPNIACELLTYDVAFGEKIAADKNALQKLFGFFSSSPITLNPILASYVSRVLADIVTRKPDQNWYSYQVNVVQLLGFLEENEHDILDWLLSQIGTSAVSDLVFKLIMNIEEPDKKANLLKWLEKQNFVQRLIKMMECDAEEVHEGVHRFVIEVVNAFKDDMSSTSDSDILISALKSYDSIATLTSAMLKDVENPVNSSINYGLRILIALLGIPEVAERPQQKSWVPINDSIQDVIISQEIKEHLLSRFKDLVALLRVEPKDGLTLASGLVQRRVGSRRLAIIKFIAQLSSLKRTEYLDEMVNTNMLWEIMDIFWSNSTNGFMHRHVEKIIMNILFTQGPNKALEYLLVSHQNEGLLIKIPKFFRETQGSSLSAYRGILARIASVISKVQANLGFQKEIYEKFQEKFKAESEVWENFVLEGLEEYQKKQKTNLGGVIAPTSGTSQSQDLLQSNDDAVWNMVSHNDFADLSNNVDFDIFSTTDRFDDNRSKSTFEMFEAFCTEKANGVADEDELSLGLDEEKLELEACSELA